MSRNDHISNLPDAILSHILSFVPTKSALKTSILSKRWKYVWTKVPILDFTEFLDDTSTYYKLTLEQKFLFNSFVGSVVLHNDVSFVQNLRFQLTEHHCFHINSWLHTLMSTRDIREIDINLSGMEPVVLPRTVLCSDKLVVLKLQGKFTIDATIPLHLPNLEVLRLINLVLLDDEFMKTVSSSCPVLKELEINCCEGFIKTLYVESLTVESLTIIKPDDKPELPGIVINVPNLRYLRLEYEVDDQVTFIGGLTLLNEVYLDIDVSHEYAIEVLRRFCMVQTMRFCTSVIWGNGINPPTFTNLRSLSFICDEASFVLLECTPNLKYLVIESGLTSVNLCPSASHTLR